MNRAEAIKIIRTALRARSGKAWSVTGGRGTAYGYITISAPPARLGCARLHRMEYTTGNTCGTCQTPYTQWADRIECKAHVCTDSCFTSYMVPEDRAELAELLGVESVHFQGQLVSPDGYEFFVKRAQHGLEEAA